MRPFFYLQNNPLKIKQIQIIIPNFRLFATPNPTFAAGNTKLLFACTGRPCGCPKSLKHPSFLFFQAV